MWEAAQADQGLTWRQSSPDLTMMGRTAQPGRRPCGDRPCTRFALSAKGSPYTARAAAAALSASSSDVLLACTVQGKKLRSAVLEVGRRCSSCLRCCNTQGLKHVIC